jgi:hypothetical protein
LNAQFLFADTPQRNMSGHTWMVVPRAWSYSCTYLLQLQL